jgi:long-chain acyl-CoA synthetase
MLSLTSLVRRAAQVNRHGIATQYGSRSRTWPQVADEIARLAGGLRARGVHAGGRVALLAFNSDRFYSSYFAIPWAGAVVVPVNFRLTTDEMAALLNDAEPVALLVDAQFGDRVDALRRAVPSLRFVAQIEGERGEADADFDALISAEPLPDAGRCDGDLAALYYTGGTTGRAKGVMLTHANLVQNALQNLAMLNYTQGDGVLHVAPLFHIGASVNAVIFTAIAGRHHFLPAFDAGVVLDTLAAQRIQRAFLVPTMINMVLNHPRVTECDVSALRSVVYGASPMPEAVIARARALWPQVQFVQAYGQTESSPCLTLLLHDQHEHHLRSAGQALPGVELVVLDADDRPLPPGQAGEIGARGPNVMPGYWRNDKATAETLRNGWLHTGDVGYFDDDGFLFVVDRVKDMIVSGGENVYSTEVEGALYQHPAVLECAVLGIPSEQWGEQVHAIVRLREGHAVTEAELIDFCRSLIAGYKCPRSIEWRREPLPLTAAGKILKRELRAPYWENRARQVN